jgi:hypothetical protein
MDFRKIVSNRRVLRVTACFLLLAILPAYAKDSNAKVVTAGRIESIWQGLMVARGISKCKSRRRRTVPSSRRG